MAPPHDSHSHSEYDAFIESLPITAIPDWQQFLWCYDWQGQQQTTHLSAADVIAITRSLCCTGACIGCGMPMCCPLYFAVLACFEGLPLSTAVSAVWLTTSGGACR